MSVWLFFSGYASIQSFLLIFSFWRKRKKINGVFFLVGMLLVTTYISLQSIIIKLEYHQAYDLLYFIGYSPIFLIGPLYFLFLSRRYGLKSSPQMIGLHFLPFLIFWASQFSSLIMGYKKYLILGFSIQLIFYSIYSIKLVSRQSSEKKFFFVFRYLNYCFGFLSVSVIIFYFSRLVLGFKGIDFTSIIILFLIFFVTVLGVAIFQENNTAFFSARNDTKKYKSSNLQEQNVHFLEEHLLQLLTTDRVYLNQNLSAEALSQKLNISRHQLSELINQKIGCSFNDLINQYRVESVKKDLLDKTKNHLSIYGLAQESGFKSPSSFYRVFKNHTGQTPLEFIESNS